MCRSIVKLPSVHIHNLPRAQTYTRHILGNTVIVIPRIPENNARTECITNKFKKQFFLILFIICSLAHFGSSIYNISIFYNANNHINEFISHLNSTELGDHNESTNNTNILVVCDVFYYLLYFIFNLLIFKKNNNTVCCVISILVMIIANWLIRNGYMNNTNDYLSDKNFNFDSSYKNDLTFSYTLFMSLYGIKFCTSLFSYQYWYI
jgi:hypothetical protein